MDPASSQEPANKRSETEKETAKENEKETTKEIERDTIKETGKEIIQETDKEILKFLKFSPKKKYDFGLASPSFSDIINKKAVVGLFPSVADAILADKETLTKIMKQSSIEEQKESSQKEPLSEKVDSETPKQEGSSQKEPLSEEVDEISEYVIKMVMTLQSGTGEISVPDDPGKTKVIEEIKNLILDGEIPEVETLLAEHYNMLLYDLKQLPCLLFPLAYQTFIEIVRQRRVEQARLLAGVTIKSSVVSCPWLREDVERAVSLLDYEDPWQSPHKELLDFSQRKLTAALVLNQIASVGNHDFKPETQIIDDIKSSILNGDLSLAIAHISGHYYELIRHPTQIPKMLYYLAYQHMIELVRCRQVEEARKFSEKSLKLIVQKHPWLREEVERVNSLLDFEDPMENCPHSELLDFPRRNLTLQLVLNEIPIVGNGDGAKAYSSCSSSGSV